jgi:hypothetical protein
MDAANRVGHRVENCRCLFRQVSKCRHAVISSKPQRKRREGDTGRLNEAKSNCIQVSKNLDSFERRVERPTPSPPGRELSSLHLSCIQSLANDLHFGRSFALHLFTEISRISDKDLWSLEAHLPEKQ